MLSVRHNGLSITEVIGIYLGKIPKQVMRVFTIVLMVLVGAVFISGPASILATLGVVAAPITSVIQHLGCKTHCERLAEVRSKADKEQVNYYDSALRFWLYTY